MKPREVLPGPVPPPKGHSARGVGTSRLSGCSVIVSPGVSGFSVSSPKALPVVIVVVVIIIMLVVVDVADVVFVVVVMDEGGPRYRRLCSGTVAPSGFPALADTGSTLDRVGKRAEGGKALVSGISGSPELI